MVKIPQYERSQGITPQGPAVRGDLGVAAAPGLALAALGGKLAAGGFDILEQQKRIADRQDEKQAAVDAAKAEAEARTAAAIRMRQAQDEAPAGAPGFLDQQLKAADDDLDARRKALTPRAAARIEPGFTKLRGEIEVHAEAFEGAARAAKRQTDTELTIDLLANEARADPGNLPDIMERGAALVDGVQLPADRRAKLMGRAQNRIALGASQALAEIDPEGLLRRLKTTEFDSWLEPASKDWAIRAAEGEIERTRRAAEVAAAKAARQMQTEARDMVDAAIAGFMPSPEKSIDLIRRAAATGIPEAAAEAGEAVRLTQTVAAARSANPQTLEAGIRALRDTLDKAKDPTPSQIRNLTVAQQILDRMNAGLSADQLTWASQAGLIGLRPLQLGAPLTGDAAADKGQSESLRAAIVERRAQAKVVAEYYSRPLALLTAAEKGAWTTVMQADDLDAQVSMLAQVAGAFGEDAPMVLAELKDKDPAIAHVGGMLAAGGNPLTARQALDGRRLIKQDAELRPKAAERRTQEIAVVGTAFAFAGETGAAAAQAAEWIYTARAQQRGLLGARVDPALYGRALQEAAGAQFHGDRQFGGIGEYQNRQVVLPPGMEPRKFADAVRSLDDAQLARAGNGGPRTGDGKLWPAADLADAWLVSIGQGRYWISLGDPYVGDRKFLRGAGRGGLYVLDFAKIGQPAVKAPAAREGNNSLVMP